MTMGLISTASTAARFVGPLNSFFGARSSLNQPRATWRSHRLLACEFSSAFLACRFLFLKENNQKLPKFNILITQMAFFVKCFLAHMPGKDLTNRLGNS